MAFEVELPVMLYRLKLQPVMVTVLSEEIMFNLDSSSLAFIA